MVMNFLNAFFVAFGLIFIAELGDKTQLIILSLACKGHSPNKLALGAVLGFAVVVFLGGFLALIITQYIDLIWITLTAGVIFVIIGIIQFIGLIRNHNVKIEPESEDAKSQKILNSKMQSSVAIGFLAIFSMEMGDKTQVMTILLAATSVSLYGTLIGSWIALSLLAIIGAVAGEWLAKKVPKRKLEWVATSAFIIIGIIMIISVVI